MAKHTVGFNTLSHSFVLRKQKQRSVNVRLSGGGTFNFLTKAIGFVDDHLSAEESKLNELTVRAGKPAYLSGASGVLMTK